MKRRAPCHLVAAPGEAGHVVGEDERQDRHVREHFLAEVGGQVAVVGLKDRVRGTARLHAITTQ